MAHSPIYETTIIPGIAKGDQSAISSSRNIVAAISDPTSRAVVLSRQWLPGLIARLTDQIGPDEAVPTDQDSLQVGARFAVQGWQVQHQDNGARRLDVIVNLPDQGRVVTIPLDLTPPDAQNLINQLK